MLPASIIIGAGIDTKVSQNEGRQINMSKTMEIAGMTFEIGKDIDYIPSIPNREVFDVYDRPSEAKRHIWSAWRNWFWNQLNCFEVGVESYNCHFFTIGAVATYEGENYYFHITSAHNTIHKIVA